MSKDCFWIATKTAYKIIISHFWMSWELIRSNKIFILNLVCVYYEIYFINPNTILDFYICLNLSSHNLLLKWEVSNFINSFRVLSIFNVIEEKGSTLSLTPSLCRPYFVFLEFHSLFHGGFLLQHGGFFSSVLFRAFFPPPPWRAYLLLHRHNHRHNHQHTPLTCLQQFHVCWSDHHQNHHHCFPS